MREVSPLTVSAQTPINRSTGNGVTTVFPYTFKIISSADMEVSVDGVVKTLTVDYTLSGVGDDAGGSVTMLAAPATSTSVVRRRNMALTRNTDYQDQGELPASTLDSDLDSAVLMIQQVDEKTDRAMVLPTYVSGFSTELPTPIANYFLRVNSAGTALELASEITPGALTVTPFIETLLNDSMQADARTTLGAAASGANTDITSLGAVTGVTATTGDSTTKLATTAFVAGAALVPVGTIIDFAKGTAPTGFLACPTSATNISRTTYAALFAVLGTTWGAGDGSTTFGMPWFPADYAGVQANANVGTSTAGAVIAHAHTAYYSSGPGGGSKFPITSISDTPTGGGAVSTTGGSANLAAGVRVLKCVKY